MSEYGKMCKEYVSEFYVRTIEEKIGYERVRPYRKILTEVAGDLIESAVETASPFALCDHITQPYYIAFGVTTCTLLELVGIYLKANEKEEKNNG